VRRGRSYRFDAAKNTAEFNVTRTGEKIGKHVCELLMISSASCSIAVAAAPAPARGLGHSTPPQVGEPSSAPRDALPVAGGGDAGGRWRTLIASGALAVAPDAGVGGSLSLLNKFVVSGVNVPLTNLAAPYLGIARWVRGKSKVWSTSTSDEAIEPATDVGGDGVVASAEGCAAAKTDGRVASGDIASGEGGGVPVEATPDPVPRPTDPASDRILVSRSPEKDIRLLIADDQQTVRAALRSLLDSQPDFEVVGEAADGAEAVALTGRSRPDVVLMDLRMPEMDGVTAIGRIKADHPRVHVLVLTSYDSDADILPAIETGATGYLLKDAPREELFEAIRAAAQGRPLPVPGAIVRSMERMRDPEEYESNHETNHDRPV
jgi:DNA-binding NarL/FixJ family response regulator